MQKRLLLIRLLVLAHVLAGLVLWSMADPPHGPIMLHLLLWILVHSQVILLAIWLALGHYATPWRLVVLIATVVAWSWINAPPGECDPVAAVYCLTQAATVVVILGLARFFGLRLYTIDAEPTIDGRIRNESRAHNDEPELKQDGSNFQVTTFANSNNIEDDRPWQFSLARLFGWTTSLAICLGLFSQTFQHCRNLSAVNLSELPVVTLVSVVVVLISLWLFLTDLRFRIPVALLTILLFGYALFFHLRYFMLLSFVLQTQPVIVSTVDKHVIMLLFFVSHIPPIFVTLLVFRVIGYRLSWKRKNS